MRYKRLIAALVLISMLCGMLSACKKYEKYDTSTGDAFYVGYAEEELSYGELDSYYMAGYKNGARPEGILDAQKVKAAFIGNGKRGVLIIAVDCIGLDSKTVSDIRERLSSFSKKNGISSVNVISTHTHAGVDTLGLWGEVGINGKNDAFIAQIIEKAGSAAENAFAAREKGEMRFSATETKGLQSDSRMPRTFDSNLYQLRFSPDDEEGNGVRIVSFAAHAESLRGDNMMISADFPGELARLVYEESGDELIFLPGAIGGLIMTPLFDGENLVNNMRVTAEKLSEYVLNPAEERILTPKIAFARAEFETELQNTLFIYYKFLGILGNDVERGINGKYRIRSELTLIRFGDVTLSLLPGEIFPELLYGTGKEEDGRGLLEIAEGFGSEFNIFIGLANDELGYIIPKSVFELDSDAPYVNAKNNHYEETNSVGPSCFGDLSEAYKEAVKRLTE